MLHIEVKSKNDCFPCTKNLDPRSMYAIFRDHLITDLGGHDSLFREQCFVHKTKYVRAAQESALHPAGQKSRSSGQERYMNCLSILA